jgi:hypothetical protein
MDWTAFLSFAAVLAPLLLLERWIHRHLQGVALLLVGDPEVAAWLYALPLLPGVALHEVSHALAAWIVGARVGRISIVPARRGDRIQLGFVPVEATGPLRTTLIGLAPVVTGCLALLLIGRLGLRLEAAGAGFAAGDWEHALAGLAQAARAPNAWLWAYLVFAISNTMLPSRSDMRAWPVVVSFLLVSAGLVAVLGLGSALAVRLAEALRWLATACGLTVLVDLPFALVIFGAERGLGRLRGVRVEYR